MISTHTHTHIHPHRLTHHMHVLHIPSTHLATVQALAVHVQQAWHTHTYTHGIHTHIHPHRLTQHMHALHIPSTHLATVQALAVHVQQAWKRPVHCVQVASRDKGGSTGHELFVHLLHLSGRRVSEGTISAQLP